MRCSPTILLLAASACSPSARDSGLEADAPGQPPSGLDITRIHAADDGFRMNQPLMGFGAQFDADGAHLQAGEDAIDVVLSAWGREEDVAPIARVAPTLGDRVERLEYARDGLTEWWLSTPGQLQVGWELEAPPAGAGFVELDLEVAGAEVTPGFDDTEVVWQGSTRSFRFAGLYAEDAEGTPLPAWMEPTESGLRIQVDDTDAVWPIFVDPTALTASWTGTPTDSGSWYGISMSASDVNGDGYPDLLVGAHWTTGRLYTYYGSSTGPATTASATIEGTAYSQFSNAVVGIDVNNDGYGDVVVAAQGNGSSTTGKFYVYQGSAAGLAATPTRTVTGTATAYLGCALANAGDVNGDGYDDLLVGAYGTSSNTGAAYLFNGSSSGIGATATTTLSGSATSDQFGLHLAPAGDVNNDGYDDVIVGSVGASSGTGAALVYHGSATGLSTTAATTLTGSGTWSYYGSAVGGGDLNGDGYSDVVVGAVGYSSYVGRAVAYYGSASGITTSGSTTLAGSTGSGLGAALVIGDYNADGYADAAIGAYSYSSGVGAVWVYSGSSTGLSTTVGGSAAGTTSAYLGQTMGAVGDVNLDGADDFLAGAPNYSTKTGFAALYYGATDADGDGYTSGTSATEDCDDSDAAVHPGATELTGDEVDQNCDDAETCYDDDDDDGFLDTTGDTRASTDTDCDDSYEGSSSDLTTDCSDSSATRYPGATEIVGDSIDQDCDNYDSCYDDDDNDGYLDTTGDTRASTDSDCNDAYEGKSTDLTTDCDDTNSAIKPGATELTGDSVDQNCDSAETCYDDDDNDGYLDSAADTRASTDTDCADAYEGTSSDLTTDCDDTVATKYPGATEVVGDGIDQSCDNTESCYDDDDNDGYLDTTADTRASTDTDCTDAYEGTATDLTTDCDDASSAIKPGATEITGDSVDQNCDGAETCYDDDDDDGYLDTTADTRASADTDCADAYEGTTSDLTTDCADTDATIHPGATETVGDEVDANCDGAETCYDDDDGDGYLDTTNDTRPSTDTDCDDPSEGSTATATTDCDDAEAGTYPGAAEVVGDEVDSDCDGTEVCYGDDDDDGFLDTTGDTLASADGDCRDAFEAPSGTPTTDCDDNDAALNPDATEIVGDEIDSNCDGAEICYDDDDDDDALDTSGDIRTSADSDCRDAYEGLASDVTTDCNDVSATVFAGAPETVADGIDQDCDGVDDCYADADGDGFGDTTVLVGSGLACDGVGESALSTDCDPAAAETWPGAPELPGSGIDEDCDGEEACFVDADGDGQGSAELVLSANLPCDGAGESPVTTDCDDANAAVFAGATELAADGVDSDCDGQEACFADTDNDGYGDPEAPELSLDLSCDGGGVSASSDDCDDADAAISPSGEELPADGTDSDCDGQERCYIDADSDTYGAASTTLSATVTCDAAGTSARYDDCDDTDPAVFPGADEVPADGMDQDCNGGEPCYADDDGDGFGGGSLIVSADLFCTGAGEAGTGDDCDDATPTTFPEAAEICNSVDDDCDGDVDEGAADCDTERERSLCGCASTDGAAFSASLLGMALLVRRRRRGV